MRKVILTTPRERCPRHFEIVVYAHRTHRISSRYARGIIPVAVRIFHFPTSGGNSKRLRYLHCVPMTRIPVNSRTRESFATSDQKTLSNMLALLSKLTPWDSSPPRPGICCPKSDRTVGQKTINADGTQTFDLQVGPIREACGPASLASPSRMTKKARMLWVPYIFKWVSLSGLSGVTQPGATEDWNKLVRSSGARRFSRSWLAAAGTSTSSF